MVEKADLKATVIRKGGIVQCFRAGFFFFLSCPEACEILVPQPGIEPLSPALEGRFLTTGPPGKSLEHSL